MTVLRVVNGEGQEDSGRPAAEAAMEQFKRSAEQAAFVLGTASPWGHAASEIAKKIDTSLRDGGDLRGIG